jgi:tol-pal system beta propeller repeat protein TolB
VLQVRGLAINCETVGNDSVAFNVPQGQTLAFSFTIDCRPARTIAFDDGHIQQIKESGANREQLTDGPSDLHPAWSGDGSRVVLSGFRNGNTDLYVFDPTAPGVQVRLTTNAQADESPAWSPTSDRIAFVSARAGNPDIWAIDATGANETNLTPYVGGDYDPAWSPDGSKIAFASDRGGIYVMNADGSDTTRITDNANDRAPSWSPDGTKLVFQRVGTCSGYYGTCEHDLYVVHANGTGVTLLFSTYNDEVDPAWSPDGVWIAFTSAPCDYYYGCYYQSTLMAVRSNGTDPRVVAVPSAYRPAWKP